MEHVTVEEQTILRILAKLRSVLVDTLNGDERMPCLLGQPCPAIHVLVKVVNALSEDTTIMALSSRIERGLGCEGTDDDDDSKLNDEPFPHTLFVLPPELVKKAQRGDGSH